MAQWITTSSGDLVNLEFVESIEARPMEGQDTRDYCQVMAFFASGREIVLIDGLDELAEAQEAVAELYEKMNQKGKT